MDPRTEEWWRALRNDVDLLDASISECRAEVGRREAAGDTVGAASLRQALPDYEAAASTMRELLTEHSIKTVVERHGPGPYSVADMAALTGADPQQLQRAIDNLTDAGLVSPLNPNPEPPV